MKKLAAPFVHRRGGRSTNTSFNEAVQVPQADFDRLARAKGSAKVEEVVKAR